MKVSNHNPALQGPIRSCVETYVVLGSGIIPVDPIMAGDTFGSVRTVTKVSQPKKKHPGPLMLTIFTVIPSGASVVARFKPIELLRVW